jgi:hypothetical protein
MMKHSRLSKKSSFTLDHVLFTEYFPIRFEKKDRKTQIPYERDFLRYLEKVVSDVDRKYVKAPVSCLRDNFLTYLSMQNQKGS